MKPKKPKKDRQLYIALTAKEREQFDALAKENQCTLRELVLQRVLGGPPLISDRMAAFEQRLANVEQHLAAWRDIAIQREKLALEACDIIDDPNAYGEPGDEMAIHR